MNSFTPNYNLDLYDVDDKPNLNDQYNDAMGKIDTELDKQRGDIVTAETAVNNLSTKVDGFDARITANTAGVGEAKTAVNNLSTEVDGLDARITANTAGVGEAKTSAANAMAIGRQNSDDIAKLQSDVGPHKFVCCLGDSWMDGYGPDAASDCGYLWKNYAVGGANIQNGIPQQLNVMKSDSDITRDNLYMVLIVAGVNDIRMTSGGLDLAVTIVNSLNAIAKSIIDQYGTGVKIMVLINSGRSVSQKYVYTSNSIMRLGSQQRGYTVFNSIGYFPNSCWDPLNLHPTKNNGPTILKNMLKNIISFGTLPVIPIRQQFNTTYGTNGNLQLVQYALAAPTGYYPLNYNLTVYGEAINSGATITFNMNDRGFNFSGLLDFMINTTSMKRVTYQKTFGQPYDNINLSNSSFGITFTEDVAVGTSFGPIPQANLEI